MKRTAFAIALLMSGAAFAQTGATTDTGATAQTGTDTTATATTADPNAGTMDHSTMDHSAHGTSTQGTATTTDTGMTDTTATATDTTSASDTMATTDTNVATDATTTGVTDVSTDTTATGTTDAMAGTSTTTTGSATADTSAYANSGQAMAMTTTPAVGMIVQPGNSNPEEDARGISVISAPAVVPAGWNGVAAGAMGGPLVDPATGQAISTEAEDYPACSATVTDNCVQAYARGGR